MKKFTKFNLNSLLTTHLSLKGYEILKIEKMEGFDFFNISLMPFHFKWSEKHNI